MLIINRNKMPKVKPIQINTEHITKMQNLEKDLDATNQEVDFKIEKVTMTIGQRIAQARMAKKLSQQQLAQKISVAVAEIKSIENGSAAVNHKLLNKICQYLKILQK